MLYLSHNTDGLYSAKRSVVIKASDDFWPRNPASHTLHIASVAYNTVFLGEFMQLDWDMFHVRYKTSFFSSFYGFLDFQVFEFRSDG